EEQQDYYRGYSQSTHGDDRENPTLANADRILVGEPPPATRQRFFVVVIFASHGRGPRLLLRVSAPSSPNSSPITPTRPHIPRRSSSSASPPRGRRGFRCESGRARGRPGWLEGRRRI